MWPKLNLMKRFLLSLGQLVLLSSLAIGQCDELFFSEYVEGWSNNKALEIYNPTGSAVDLSEYRLERYSNGATVAQDNQKIDLVGVLSPDSVLVVVLDKQDPDGVDYEQPVWDELAAVADLWLCPVFDENNTMYFNGNDAMVLRKISSNTVVDIFGKIGEDPGAAGWAEMTQNHTLIRKPSVLQGDTDAVNDFLVVDEWDGLMWYNDTSGSSLDEVFVNLGFHHCNCSPNPPVPSGCTDTMACNFDATAIEDDGSCWFPEDFGYCDCALNGLDAIGVCGGDCPSDEDENGVCDDAEVYGCTYSTSLNFEPEASRDDGSCVFNMCGEGTIWDPATQLCIIDQSACGWQPDGNDDGLVGVSDLLDLLGVYGDVDVDQDGVWDSGDLCVDTSACNYAQNPSLDCAYLDILGVCGGGCEADEDADGICDDADACVGELDECGVCNGPGPTEIIIEEIVITYDSIYLPVDGEWFVYAVGVDTTFTYTCAPQCGDPVSYFGYDYSTVLIGEQCWFAENLRNEHYQNGDAIPAGLSDGEWLNTTSGAVAVYGEDAGCDNYSPDINACDPAQSLSEYGRLYNWYAVDDARGLCPSGWHVPTDGEWTVMTDYLGGEVIAGGQMKSDYGWWNSGNGTNSSGFSALPGGFRFGGSGYFFAGGDAGLWWSSSHNGSGAWQRTLSYAYGNQIWRQPALLENGQSVRCVRDAE